MYHTNDLCRHHNKNLEQQQFVCFGRITIESCVQQSQTLPNRNRKLIRRKTNKINTILHLARSSMFQLIRVAGVVVIFFVSLSLSLSLSSLVAFTAQPFVIVDCEMDFWNVKAFWHFYPKQHPQSKKMYSNIEHTIDGARFITRSRARRGDTATNINNKNARQKRIDFCSLSLSLTL